MWGGGRRGGGGGAAGNGGGGRADRPGAAAGDSVVLHRGWRLGRHAADHQGGRLRGAGGAGAGGGGGSGGWGDRVVEREKPDIRAGVGLLPAGSSPAAGREGYSPGAVVASGAGRPSGRP